jgi:hypothetical protein
MDPNRKYRRDILDSRVVLVNKSCLEQLNIEPSTRLVTHLSFMDASIRSLQTIMSSSAAVKGKAPANGAAAEIPYELPWYHYLHIVSRS